MQCCVLLVDDENALREELEEFLSSYGMTVSSVPTAEEALYIFDSTPAGRYQVILTDIKMPGLDGLSFASQILAATSDETAVEVIVMTGHGLGGKMDRSVGNDIFAFIPKPLPLDTLIATVRSAFDSALARRARCIT